MTFKCVVCKEEFTDGWDHALSNAASADGHGGAFLGPKDEAHAKYMKEQSKNGYDDGTCFCGGHITARGTGPETWETTCDECEFLFDED